MIEKIEQPKITELFYNGVLFKKDDLVRTVYPWYSTLESKQGIIIGFSYFEFRGEDVPEVLIETETGEFYKTHPENIEKIDDSWLGLC